MSLWGAIANGDDRDITAYGIGALSVACCCTPLVVRCFGGTRRCRGLTSSASSYYETDVRAWAVACRFANHLAGNTKQAPLHVLVLTAESRS